MQMTQPPEVQLPELSSLELPTAVVDREPLDRPAPTAWVALAEDGNRVELFHPLHPNRAVGRGIFRGLTVLPDMQNTPAMGKVTDFEWYISPAELLRIIPAMRCLPLTNPNLQLLFPANGRMLRPLRVAGR